MSDEQTTQGPGPSGPWSGQPGPSGPWSGQPGPSGPWSGQPGPSGPWSGQPGPSGPWSGQPGPSGPRRLERSTTESMVAGVAGGLGRYFGLDPVLFRIAFVVLALAGGGGILLYALAWALLPRQGQDRSAIQAAVERPDKAQRVVAGLVVFLGFMIVLGDGDFLSFGDGSARKLFKLGALVAAAGAAFWLFNQDNRGSAAPPPPPPPPPAPFVSPPWPQPGTESSEDSPSGVPPSAEPTDGEPVTQTMPTQAMPAPAMPTQTIPTQTMPTQAMPASDRSLTKIAIACLLIGGGVALLTGIRPVLFLAVALLGLGGALLTGNRFGRTRGMIPVGLLLIVALGLAALVEAASVPLSGGAGQRVWRPTTVAAIPDEYRLGAGQARLDLTRLALTEADNDVEVDVTIGMGELTVVIPNGFDVEIDAKASLGEVGLFGTTTGGPDVERQLSQRTAAGTDLPTFDLNLEVGFGQIRVIRAS